MPNTTDLTAEVESASQTPQCVCVCVLQLLSPYQILILYFSFNTGESTNKE